MHTVLETYHKGWRPSGQKRAQLSGVQGECKQSDPLSLYRGRRQPADSRVAQLLEGQTRPLGALKQHD